jgi:tetratricopeptide (TPR) repeat protein
MRCLDDRLAEATALSGMLAKTDDAVADHAALATLSLSPIEACNDTESLRARRRPKSAAQAAEAGRLSDALSRARAVRDLGNYAEALTQAKEVLGRARELGDRALQAEAHLLVGELAARLTDYPAASSELREAVWGALAIRDEATALTSVASLVEIDGYRLAHREEAAIWERTARALLSGHADGAGEALLEQSLGSLSRAEGRYGEAREHLEKALALEKSVHGDAHPAIATTLTTLAYDLVLLGRFEDAERVMLEAVRMRENILGGEHPLTAEARSMLGNIYIKAGRFEEAQRELERALAVQEATLGKGHLETGYTLNRLGNALVGRGDFEEANVVYARVLALGENKLGRTHPEVGLAHLNYGVSFERLGRLEEAEAELFVSRQILEDKLGRDYAYVGDVLAELGAVRLAQKRLAEAEAFERDAIRILEKNVGEVHPQLVEPLVWLAQCALARGKPKDAVPVAERALAMAPPEQMPYAVLGEARFTLARALWDANQDRPRAVALAKDARAAFRGTSARDRARRAEADAWLSGRG